MAFGSALSACEDSSAERKTRGAFFTPKCLADYIAEWAIRSSEDMVLEPSCGEAVFIESCAERSFKLGGDKDVASSRIVGYEIHGASAQQARLKLLRKGFHCMVKTEDFLSSVGTGEYDAVVGNPPYVRFQLISEEQRSRIASISMASGVSMSSLSSLWAPFVVNSAMFLKKGGRLGLVLPAELLSVNYAAPIRSFLLSSFSLVRLVTFDERVFPEVQEEVVLLMAEGYKSGCASAIEWIQCSTVSDLRNPAIGRYIPRENRWSGLFASKEALESLRFLVSEKWFSSLEDWGTISLGLVTGNNSYFALTDEAIQAKSLPPDDLVDLCPPGTRHLRRLDFDSATRLRFIESGERVYLFAPRDGDLESNTKRYIEEGEVLGVNRGYKCKNRSPWWRIPLGDVPDIFITYINSYGPNLCSNSAHSYVLNSCHGLKLKNDVRDLGMKYLPLACLNSATLFSSEIVGRSYGGGMLKLEPREAARLLVPSISLVERCGKRLAAIKSYADTLLASKNNDAVVNLVDAILASEMGDEWGAMISQMSSSATMMRLRRRKRSKVVKNVSKEN